VRLPGGEYREIHTPLDPYEKWKLVAFEEYEPAVVRPNAKGTITLGSRLRAGVSRFYFEDRITPVTKDEIEESKRALH